MYTLHGGHTNNLRIEEIISKISFSILGIRHVILEEGASWLDRPQYETGI